MEEIKQIGDRLTVLRDGNYIGTYEVKDIDIDTIIQLMVGRKVDEKYPKEHAEISDTVLDVCNLKNAKLKNISLV